MMQKQNVYVVIREKWVNEEKVIRTVRVFDYEPDLPDPDCYVVMKVAVESKDSHEHD